jgi:hypothetical protein
MSRLLSVPLPSNGNTATSAPATPSSSTPGFLKARRDNWGHYSGGPAPGPSLGTATWFHHHDVAIIASDTWGLEVQPALRTVTAVSTVGPIDPDQE